MAAPHSSVARASLRSLPAYDDDGNVGPLALPVTVTAGQASATPAAVVAQQAGCEIHLSFGGLTVNLLGLDVALSPITIDIVPGTGPLGTALNDICAALEAAGGVVGLIADVLNTLLGLLGGVLGGI